MGSRWTSRLTGVLCQSASVLPGASMSRTVRGAGMPPGNGNMGLASERVDGEVVLTNLAAPGRRGGR
jgi:hypothetical protein